MSGLKEEQYLDSSNYSARINLHYKFSSNRYSWPLWIFDNILKMESGRVLELGCGNGLFWKMNADRIPDTWDITLTDFSQGMLNDAQINIGDASARIKYEVLDAENIQFEDNTFDMILANHMLYHVPDRIKALSEISRVLKNDGAFYATTMQSGYMSELWQIIREYRSVQSAKGGSNSVIDNFSLQNGEEQLREFFIDVDLRIYKNTLIITEAAPLADYVVSLNNIIPGKIVLQENMKEEFIEFIQKKIDIEGSINTSADAGIFISRNQI